MINGGNNTRHYSILDNDFLLPLAFAFCSSKEIHLILKFLIYSQSKVIYLNFILDKVIYTTLQRTFTYRLFPEPRIPPLKIKN